MSNKQIRLLFMFTVIVSLDYKVDMSVLKHIMRKGVVGINIHRRPSGSMICRFKDGLSLHMERSTVLINKL